MFRGFLSEKVKLVKIQDHTTAGTTTITSSAVDTQGYDGVLFFTSYGTAAADNIAKVQQSSDDAAADAYADLVGSGVASGTSDEDVWIDIQRPKERYLKFLGVRGTSSTLESMWAILYNPRSVPVDNTTSGTITGEANLSTAEGTA